MEAVNARQPALLFRACRPDDLDNLVEIAHQTFDETFRPLNTPETIQAYLESAFTRPKFAAELADPRSRFYFLYKRGRLAGYLKLNDAGAQTDLNDPDSIEIERIYVRKEYQGQGLGRILVERALEIARLAGVKFVWLGVWQKNTAAIGFYRRMGFRAFATHTFVMGEEQQTDDLMRLELEENEPQRRQERKE